MLLAALFIAKPIAFADGTTVMGEYGAGTMTEAQAFYAPSFRYSVGGGHLSLNSFENDDTRDISYARFNYRPKRWNMEAAQANLFVWEAWLERTLSHWLSGVAAVGYVIGAAFAFGLPRLQ